MLCTVKTTRYFIPGETNTSERLRKYAFDSGIFTLLFFIHEKLRDVEPFASLKEHIKTKVLNLLEYQDLTYHVKVLKNVNTNWKEPKSEEKPIPTSFLQQNSPQNNNTFEDTIQEEINSEPPTDL